jgi:hypothetical protein
LAIASDSTPSSAARRCNVAYLKTLYGQHYVSDSLDGPWVWREILVESRQPRENRIMGKSGFDRAFEEKEKRRRRLREAQDMPVGRRGRRTPLPVEPIQPRIAVFSPHEHRE